MPAEVPPEPRRCDPAQWDDCPAVAHARLDRWWREVLWLVIAAACFVLWALGIGPSRC